MTLVAFSPDGKLLASASVHEDYRPLCLWERSTGKLLHVLKGHQNSFASIGFSPDGKVLASTSFDNVLRLWDVASGEPLRTLSRVTGQVAFSPDGKLLAWPSSTEIHLWDPATAKDVRVLNAAPDHITALAFSPDGSTLASAVSSPKPGKDQFRIRLWEPATGKERGPLGGHDFPIESLAFAAGKTLASGARDGVRLWDLATGTQVFHNKRVLATLACAPDGKTLACLPGASPISLLDAATGTERRQLAGHRAGTRCVAFSPDGTVLASGGLDTLVRLWPLADHQELPSLQGHDGPVQALAFSPNGRALASRGADRALTVWDPLTARPIRSIKPRSRRAVPPESYYNEHVRAAAYSPDGKLLATIADRISVLVCDATSGKELRRLDNDGSSPLSYLTEVSFSPDGKSVAAGTEDATIILWDPATGRTRRTLNFNSLTPPRSLPVRSIAFSPDGRRIAAGVQDRAFHPGDPWSGPTMYLWDISSGKIEGHLRGHTGETSRVGFSPDGTLLASAGSRARRDGVIRLWSATTLQLLGEFQAHESRVRALAFSPTGSLIATGGNDHSVRVWETLTRKRVLEFAGHTGPVRDVAFHPHADQLASASEDTTVLIWDLRPRPSPGQPRPARLTAMQLSELWAQLAGPAAEAYQAAGTLIDAPSVACAFLKQQLKPVAAPDPESVRLLSDRLSSDDASVREGASARLQDLGTAAEGPLRKLLETMPRTEVDIRVRALLRALHDDPRPTIVQRVRAIQVLERIASSEATRILEDVAQGYTEAQETKQARAALRRLAGQ